MKRISSLLLTSIFSLAALNTSMAQTADEQRTEISASVQSGEFLKKRYTVKGSWTFSNLDGNRTIQFSDDFKTKSGPDLKVFLSTKSMENIDSKTAIHDAIKIGVLKSNKGAQTYVIPNDVNLSEFKSVIVHCEAFSVLWGGFDIPE